LGEVVVTEIDPGTAAYEQARELRYRVLYAPLGLSRALVEDTDGHRYIHFAAVAGDRVVGYARLHLESSPSRAYQVSVSEDMRRAGIGRMLMETVAARARAEGRDRLELDARDHAIAFYERLGYEVVSGEFASVRTGTPHRTMRLEL
jgi:predicted GNAT family N-acyltransferase